MSIRVLGWHVYAPRSGVWETIGMQMVYEEVFWEFLPVEGKSGAELWKGRVGGGTETCHHTELTAGWTFKMSQVWHKWLDLYEQVAPNPGCTFPRKNCSLRQGIFFFFCYYFGNHEQSISFWVFLSKEENVPAITHMYWPTRCGLSKDKIRPWIIRPLSLVKVTLKNTES